MTVISGGVNISAASGDVCVAMWQNYPLERCISGGWDACDVIQSINNTRLMLNPATVPLGVIQATYAIGLFSRVSAATDLLGAGASVFTYYMV